MIADWQGMSKKFGGTAQNYYIDNVYKFILHDETIKTIDYIFFKIKGEKYAKEKS